MVDLRASNKKLTDRAERIIMSVTGIGRPEAGRLLVSSFGNAKIAIVMHKTGLDYAKAREALDAHGGIIRKVLHNLRK